MSAVLRALRAEIAKLRRATLPLWTALVVLMSPVMTGVMGTADRAWFEGLSWSDFVGMGGMNMATWYGILLFGLVASFIFGREYADGVVPNALTVPIRREYLVLAKLAILAAWVLVLAVLAVVAQGTWAAALGHTGFAWDATWTALADSVTIALLIFLTLPVVALFAVGSRGTLAPMIFSAMGFSAGMIGGVAGWGEWLPWAMPSAIGGSFLQPLGPATDTTLGTGQWAIAVGVFVLGVAALLWWVNHADATS